jgi:RNA-directed DNA polymerase
MGTIDETSPYLANIHQPSMAEHHASLKKMLTFSGCFVAREFGESSQVRTQMTAHSAGALTDDAKQWSAINWQEAWRQVRRLQMRIAKATKEGKRGKAKALQRILTRSFYAKLLAVKRVTSNKGKNTPGVDGVLWRGVRAKMQAARRLKQHGYKAQPLRRIYIAKKNGKKRPLSIPTMHDRAMQALYKLALAPVAETTADRNSYGFREGRRCADAIAAAFNALSKPISATWILEGDITGCFDNISTSWLLENILIEKAILRKWLSAGYVENGVTYPSHKGTPQGGIISPTLSNMTLDGLEQAVHAAVPRRNRVNFIRYADDFIITGKSKRLLKESIQPVVEQFLKERGLTLSAEKTHITHIKQGFTFLGQTFRKAGNKLLIKPSKEGVQALVRKVGTLIRKHVSAPMEVLIGKLNTVLRGWANYHRHVVASEAFSRVDNYVFHQLWRMLRRRHTNKSKGWIIDRYWKAAGKKWIFTVTKKVKRTQRTYQVLRASSIGIRRHIKIKAEANPYLQEYALYFHRRRQYKESRLMKALTARAQRALSLAG